MRDSAENYRMLFQTIEQGVVYQDTAGRITEANPAAERILGLSRDEMLGITSMDPRWHCINEAGSVMQGKDHPAMIALQTGEPVRNVPMGVFNPRENRTRWVRVTALPLFQPGETTPYEVYATITDETERRLAAMEKEKVEARFRNLFNDMNEGGRSA